MNGFGWYDDDEDDETVEGLFGDRHSSVRNVNCEVNDNKVFDRDRYNEDGNPKGWSKTKETW